MTIEKLLSLTGGEPFGASLAAFDLATGVVGGAILIAAVAVFGMMRAARAGRREAEETLETVGALKTEMRSLREKVESALVERDAALAAAREEHNAACAASFSGHGGGHGHDDDDDDDDHHHKKKHSGHDDDDDHHHKKKHSDHGHDDDDDHHHPKKKHGLRLFRSRSKEEEAD